MENQKFGKYTRKLRTDYCVIDTETTGFSYYCERMIEIAVLRVRNNEVVAQYSQLINPFDDEYTELPPEITKLTGITGDMLSGQPTAKEIKYDVLNFIGTDLIVGHNTQFDMHFLGYGFECDLENEYVDTYQLAKTTYRNLDNYKLSYLAEHFNLPTNSHRALKDCYTTMELYKLLQKEVERQRNAQGIASSEIDGDGYFYGRECVFSGTFARSQEDMIELAIRNGARVRRNADGKPLGIAKTTNYLIVGCLEYTQSIKNGKTGKMDKAEKLKSKGYDIEIITEREFYDLLGMSKSLYPVVSSPPTVEKKTSSPRPPRSSEVCCELSIADIFKSK